LKDNYESSGFKSYMPDKDGEFTDDSYKYYQPGYTAEQEAFD